MTDQERRKVFRAAFKAWLATDAGRPWQCRIDDCEQLEEPDFTLAKDAAWDMAEHAFEVAHPEHAMSR